MKYLIAALMFFASWFSSQAQTNLRSVMVNTNGVVQRPTNFIATNRLVSVDTNGAVANPTNFWTANSNSINSVVSNASSTFNAVELAYRIRQAFFVNSTIESLNSTVSITNSFLSTSIAGTNNSGIAAVRLLSTVNQIGPQGAGTLFGNHSHRAWIQLDSVPRENGLVRFVLGGNQALTTNIAQYPTNRSVGFELRSLGGSTTNEIRLIAHNGTTNTNGNWVTLGTLFQKYTIGVEQNKSNGQVQLWIGAGSVNPTLNTNATINGGPTNNASTGESALEVGLFTTNTNAASINLAVFSALVEITD